MDSLRFKRLSKEFFWISIAQVISLFGTFAGIRILTGLLDPSQYGQLALGMTISTFFQAIAFSPIGNGATRFFSSAKEAGSKSLSGYFYALYRFFRPISIFILSLALIFLMISFYSQSLYWISLIVPSLIFSLFSGLNNIFNNIQNAARNRTIVAFHQALMTLGRVLGGSLIVFLFGAKSSNAMWGYSLSMIVVFFSQIYFVKRTLLRSIALVRPIENSIHKWRSVILSYSWPFSTWGILGWGRTASERWAIDIFSSTKDVGIYSALYQIGFYPITIFFTMLLSFINPIIFQRAGDGLDKSRLKKIYHYCWKLTLFGFILVTIFSLISYLNQDLIFSILLPKSYHAYSYLLPFVVLAGGINSISHHTTTAIHSHNKTAYLIIPTNLMHVIGLIINVYGAAMYGVNGLVLGLILYSIISLFVIIIMSFKTYKELNLA